MPGTRRPYGTAFKPCEAPTLPSGDGAIGRPVPARFDDPERLKGDAAWEVLGSFTKPVLTLWGDHCPHTYTEQGEQFRAGIPGAQLPGIEHKMFHASHYIQEDLGPEIAAQIVGFIDQFPR